MTKFFNVSIFQAERFDGTESMIDALRAQYTGYFDDYSLYQKMYEALKDQIKN